MSSIGNPSSMYARKAVKQLSAALVVVLLAMMVVSLASVFAQGSSIKITQTIAPNPIVEGNKATFTLVVEKATPGTADLKEVAISNTQTCTLSAPTKAGGDTDDILEDGETWTYTCEATATTDGELKNKATVTAKSVVDNLTVQASDEDAIQVLNAGIHVTKELDAGQDPIFQGATVNFTIKVRNTSQVDVPAAKITLTDIATPGNSTCDPAINVALPVADGGTVGVIDKSSTVDGLGGEAWEYKCAIKNVQDDFTNKVTVTAKDKDDKLVGTHEASASATVKNPGLAVKKAAHKATVTSGETVKWTINITNTGETGLQLTSITDVDNIGVSNDPDCSLTPAPVFPVALSSGASVTYTCDELYSDAQVPQSGVIENTATVAATVDGAAAPAVTSVTKSSTASVSFVKVGLEVNKTPATQKVVKDGTAKFTITAKNTGQGDLTGVTIEDLKCTTLSAKSESGAADNKINPGETWSWTCEIKTVTADFSNVAVVRAKDVSGIERSGTGVAFVDVINPGINISKSGPASVNYGGEAAFTLIVTNNGDTELSNVDVTDAQCDAKPVRTVGVGDKLAVGGSWTYTCSKKNVSTDFENIALVKATDVLGEPRTDDSNPVKVNVLRPDLRLSKQPKLQVVEEGKAIQWTLYVTNVGQITLDPIGAAITDYIIDPMCKTLVADAGNALPLASGTRLKFTCTADPAISFMSDEIKNTATAIFKAGSATIIDSDSAETEVLRNSLNLQKSPRSATVLKGSDAIFDFNVSVVNRPGTPAQTLHDVKVEDALCPGGKATLKSGDDGDNLLESTEVWRFECTVPNVQANLSNTAKASGLDSNNRLISDIDSATLSVVNAQLTVKKSTGSTIVNVGMNVTFDIEVSNTGDNNLVDVVVVDTPSLGACQGGNTLSRISGDNGDNKLNKGETWKYVCTINNIQGDTTNTASVSSKDEVSGLPVTANAAPVAVSVLRPGINLEKSPETQTINQGSNAIFELKVSNAGNAAITNVNVVDNLCVEQLVVPSSGDTDNDKVLDQGETWVYPCTVVAVMQNLTNSAAVTGISAGQAVADTDTASVTVIVPPTVTPTPVTPTVTPTPVTPTATPVPTGKLKLQKSPATQTIVKGTTATFQVTLNNGTVEDLTNVVLSDPQCTTLTRLADAPGNNDNTLNKGETWRWTCTIVNVQKSFTNKAKATAIRPNGKKLTASASAKVKVVNSNQLRVETSVNDAAVNAGASLPMRVTVTNIGAGNLRNLQVSHNACTDALVYVGGDVNGDNVLNRGESWAYTCTIANIQGDVNGLATAAAIDDSDVVQEADALTDVTVITDEENEAAAEEPAFKIFTPLIVR